MLTFLRAIKFALQDIVRNMSLSFMTVFVLILMLLSINTVFVVRIITTEATEAIKQQIDVSIYFDHEATDQEVEEVKNYVGAFPEVTDSIFYNHDEVLEQFKEQYADNPDIIRSLDELGENPLGPTLVVKTREPSDYKKIIAALSVPEYENIIEAKTFADTEIAIDKINNVTQQLERFSLGLSVFFAIVAFLIIFNTIRIAIYTQRIEISIKKLVGATNWFIRGPYLIEAAIFSILSVAITYAMVYIVAGLVDPYIAVILETDTFLTNYFLSNILMLVGIQFLIVLILTVFSSVLAMRRHLRV